MSEELLTKINDAVKAANEAQIEQVSRSKAVGLLLLEAKKLDPTKKQFEAFLNRVNGLKVSRAYDANPAVFDLIITQRPGKLVLLQGARVLRRSDRS
jgi:hypothetical protein